MMVTLKALKQLGIPYGQARVVIQGFGNVGGMAAKLMKAAGFKIVCIVEYDLEWSGATRWNCSAIRWC